MEAYESWRSLSDEKRAEIADAIREVALDRYVDGGQSHGDHFEGDPLMHLRDELIDGLFYVEMAIRERAELNGGKPGGARAGMLMEARDARSGKSIPRCPHGRHWMSCATCYG